MLPASHVASPGDTLLPSSPAALEIYEVMAMLSRKDSVSLGAAAVGADAIFMTLFVSKSVLCGASSLSSSPPCFTVAIHHSPM